MSAYWCQPVDPLFVTRKAPSIFHASSTLLGLHAVLIALICVKCELLMPVHRASRSEGSKLDFGPKCVWFSSLSHSSVHELVFNNIRGLRFFFFQIVTIIRTHYRKSRTQNKEKNPITCHPAPWESPLPNFTFFHSRLKGALTYMSPWALQCAVHGCLWG